MVEHKQPTPISFNVLTDKNWIDSLKGALECLDDKRHYKGRATMGMTLISTNKKVEGQVSPHLAIEVSGNGYSSWDDFLLKGKEQLMPVYDWAIRVTD